jgi:hypothetical protein
LKSTKKKLIHLSDGQREGLHSQFSFSIGWLGSKKKSTTSTMPSRGAFELLRNQCHTTHRRLGYRQRRKILDLSSQERLSGSGTVLGGALALPLSHSLSIATVLSPDRLKAPPLDRATSRSVVGFATAFIGNAAL